jgi:CheY-like chemotaxis protein
MLLLVADDLMFPSRIREGLRPLGYTLQVASTEESARQQAEKAELIAVLVNLNARRYDPATVIRQFKTEAKTAHIPLLAFAGHVEREKHQTAREAGADMIAANSSVAMHLAPLLQRLLSGKIESENGEDVVEIENEA